MLNNLFLIYFGGFVAWMTCAWARHASTRGALIDATIWPFVVVLSCIVIMLGSGPPGSCSCACHDFDEEEP